jgi:Tfp pilus assembly protein PilN
VFLQSSLGIHIENGTVSIALLKSALRGVRLAASEVRSIDGELPVKERVKKISELVGEFLEKFGASPGTIFFSIPREMVVARTITLPAAVKQNLRGALRYEMEKYAPFAADDVFFDFQVLNENKKEGTLEILLVIARGEDLRIFIGLRDLIGRGISGIEIGSTAIVNSLAHACPVKDSHMAAYLSQGLCEILVVKKGLLGYSRTFASPGNQDLLLDAVASGLEQARKSSGAEIGPMGVVLCGPAASEAISTGLKNKGFILPEVRFSGPLLPSQSLIPAVGLALKGLAKLPNQVNLLPAEMQKRPSKAGYYVMVLLLITALAGGFGWWGSGVFQQRLYIQDLDRETARLRSEVAVVEEVRRDCGIIERELNDLVSSTDLGTPLLEVLKELTSRVPQTAWLNDMTFSKGKVVISGFAATASELIPLLEESPLFRNVVFLSTITKTREGQERFRISLEVI